MIIKVWYSVLSVHILSAFTVLGKEKNKILASSDKLSLMKESNNLFVTLLVQILNCLYHAILFAHAPCPQTAISIFITKVRGSNSLSQEHSKLWVLIVCMYSYCCLLLFDAQRSFFYMICFAGGSPREILSSLGNGFVDKMEHIVRIILSCLVYWSCFV